MFKLKELVHYFDNIDDMERDLMAVIGDVEYPDVSDFNDVLKSHFHFKAKWVSSFSNPVSENMISEFDMGEYSYGHFGKN